MKDSEGNERSDEQVRELVRRSLRDMALSDILDLVIEGVGLSALPDDMTKCPCHGLWYDACIFYR